MNLKYQKEIKLPQRIKSNVKNLKYRKRKNSKVKKLKHRKEGKVSERIKSTKKK